MRVISFNANGIRSAARKGFFEWLATVGADVVCLQETKAHVSQLGPEFYPEGYHCHYVDAEKKGYSGVAIYTRQQPLEVVDELPLLPSNQEARYVHAAFPDVNVASIYLPSGTSGDARQQVKYAFLDFYQDHLSELKQSSTPWILCGDWNIAHRQIDLTNWRANQKHSGFLPQEREWMDQLFDDWGYADAFRCLQSGGSHYTWWSYRGQSWLKNVGWRIDYQVISESLRDAVREVAIYKQERFSDHAPLIIDYDLDVLCRSTSHTRKPSSCTA